MAWQLLNCQDVSDLCKKLPTIAFSHGLRRLQRGSEIQCEKVIAAAQEKELPRVRVRLLAPQSLKLKHRVCNFGPRHQECCSRIA